MDRQQQIPYGVFLAAGCAVAVFAGPGLLRPFHAASRAASARQASAHDLHPQSLLVPLGVLGDPDGGPGEDASGRPHEGGNVEEVRRGRPGELGGEDPVDPGELDLEELASLLDALLGLLGVLQGLPIVELDRSVRSEWTS